MTRSSKHAIAILALGVLAGCEATEGDVAFAASGVVVGAYTDKRTGCQYLISNGGITPRLNPDGTQVCMQKDESHE